MSPGRAESCDEPTVQDTNEEREMMTIPPKLLAITLIGITVLSVTIVVSLPQPKSSVPPMMEIPDSDKDGKPDDQDRLPMGNAGVELSITTFVVKNGCGNWFPIGSPACDPKFRVEWDVNLDGDWDGRWSREYSDVNKIEVVFRKTIDIPDDATRLRVLMKIVDEDGGETIDYWSTSFRSWGYLELSLTQGPQGIDLEGKGEVSASLTLHAEIVQIP